MQLTDYRRDSQKNNILKFLCTVLVLIYSLNVVPEEQYGQASYYHSKFEGRKAANGSIFSNQEFTCATGKEYPFSTELKVTNTKNNKSVNVIVTDRGSFSRKYPKRKVDLSQKAFRAISSDGSLREGLLEVKIEVVSLP